MSNSLDPGLRLIQTVCKPKKNPFLAFPGFMICVFFLGRELSKAQPKVFLIKPGIEPTTPGLQGIALFHYTTAASTVADPEGVQGNRLNFPPSVRPNYFIFMGYLRKMG